MPKEIERKFLVSNKKWRGLGEGVAFRQGYLALGPPVAIRVRIEGDQAYLNIKQATLDIERDEFEYPIPLDDAKELLLNHCVGSIIEKTRYKILYMGMLWEVDEFHGDNAGLICAEVELEDRNQSVDLPDWVGVEVSGDARYLNVSLSQHPYTKWDKD